MLLLYNFSISLYSFGAKIAGLFNPKAKLFSQGRKHIFSNIEKELNQVRVERKKQGKQTHIIWVHCSSVGEFEQARPLIESIKRRQPDYFILLTFFSPSGYELRKNYEYADWVFYLPMDTTHKANKFLNIVQPVKTIFIKYEFWYNYLHGLKKRNIPTYIVSALFRENQIFFKWYGGFFRKLLTSYNMLFVQDENSKKLLNSIGIDNVEISGDTRFDRVYKLLNEKTRKLDIVDAFSQGNKKLWVAGSTWPEDEKNILMALNRLPSNKLILVPHEIFASHIEEICKRFSQYNLIKYSDILAKLNSFDTSLAESRKQIKEYFKKIGKADILLVDEIGFLSSLYKYGSFAYIGGGFGAGIHNILEAATYGAPIVFGPNYKKFREANQLIEKGGAFSYISPGELVDILEKWLTDENFLWDTSTVCRNYVSENLGATELIMANI